jgi:hypothetical protein
MLKPYRQMPNPTFDMEIRGLKIMMRRWDYRRLKEEIIYIKQRISILPQIESQKERETAKLMRRWHAIRELLKEKSCTNK